MDGYSIYNEYFDNSHFRIINISITKPKYKEKLRMRAYTYPLKQEDIVFLELKKKFDRKVNKRRVALSYQDYLNLVNNHLIPEVKTALEKQILNEIVYHIKTNEVKPAATLIYDRVALVSEDGSLRVTFDKNINYLKDNNKTLVLKNDLILMEIKPLRAVPLWLAEILSDLGLYANSFSKYGVAYEKIILLEER